MVTFFLYNGTGNRESTNEYGKDALNPKKQGFVDTAAAAVLMKPEMTVLKKTERERNVLL